jgi:hypothetical protein
MNEDASRRFFDESITDRERAIFEAGVALATAYHQFVGTPVKPDEESLHRLEETIRDALMAQPFRTRAEVRLSVSPERRSAFAYASLTAEMFDVSVTTRYGGAEVTSRMRFIDELSFPLMYVERAEGDRSVKRSR